LPAFLFNTNLFSWGSNVSCLYEICTAGGDLKVISTNLTKFQKGVYYSAIKIFNNLPHDIKDLANEVIPFWNTLRRFLLILSFYNSDEYFNYKRHSIEH
jgi:hypothetical protein